MFGVESKPTTMLGKNPRVLDESLWNSKLFVIRYPTSKQPPYLYIETFDLDYDNYKNSTR
jgi:hypothetical protein